MPVGPNTTFAGSGLSLTSMPIDFSSCLTICSVVVRTELLAVHVQKIDAGRPEHCQICELLALGALGPPVQCAFMIARAFAALKLNLAKSCVYPSWVW